ncbi:MAG: hypothetical protein QOI02_1601 [Actinomycetota bacterium]|nr:hypothetical protein [Glaciihabitans sp.]MDQ1556599.1 hypothetical protein [Actinomycetota bacterium]
MSPKIANQALRRRWSGIALIAVPVVATVWLGLTDQLILYIHPRYVVFTLIMGLIALVLIVSSFVQRPDDDHDHQEPRGRLRGILAGTGGVVVVVLAVAMLAIPPATLSSATVAQRDINGSALGNNRKSIAQASSASASASAKFTVLDWSSLLRQTSDPAFYANKPADVVGFISPDPDDPANVFYVSRFVITCCAVDAQPVGVPVYLPNWTGTFKKDQWVRVTGAFATNPSSTSRQQLALGVDAIAAVPKPKAPYLY